MTPSSMLATKADAEEALTALLKHRSDIFQGKERELVVLAMCSFACDVLEKEMKLLLSSQFTFTKAAS